MGTFQKAPAEGSYSDCILNSHLVNCVPRSPSGFAWAALWCDVWDFIFHFFMLYVWMQVGGSWRSTGCLSFIILHHIFETTSVTDPGAHWLSQTDWTSSLSRTHLSLSPMYPNTEVTDVHGHIWLLYGYWGPELGSLSLCNKHFTPSPY